MRRYYFVSDDLDDLSSIEKELEERGISTPQIHVLSMDDAGLQQHHLNDVAPLMRRDVFRTVGKSAIFGFLSAVLVIFFAIFSGATESIGWAPFVLLALVVMGFITWEGGMWGIQEPNVHFKRFQEVLDNGKHVLYVEVSKGKQESMLKEVIGRHTKLQGAGWEPSANALLIGAENGAHRFVKWAP
ncbi:NAD/FAD-utilizing enzyme [Porticoccus sp.]